MFDWHNMEKMKGRQVGIFFPQTFQILIPVLYLKRVTYQQMWGIGIISY